MPAGAHIGTGGFVETPNQTLSTSLRRRRRYTQTLARVPVTRPVGSRRYC